MTDHIPTKMASNLAQDAELKKNLKHLNEFVNNNQMFHQ